jgi:hypothetical protein
MRKSGVKKKLWKSNKSQKMPQELLSAGTGNNRKQVFSDQKFEDPRVQYTRDFHACFGDHYIYGDSYYKIECFIVIGAATTTTNQF